MISLVLLCAATAAKGEGDDLTTVDIVLVSTASVVGVLTLTFVTFVVMQWRSHVRGRYVAEDGVIRTRHDDIEGTFFDAMSVVQGIIDGRIKASIHTAYAVREALGGSVDERIVEEVTYAAHAAAAAHVSTSREAAGVATATASAAHDAIKSAAAGDTEVALAHASVAKAHAASAKLAMHPISAVATAPARDRTVRGPLARRRVSPPHDTRRHVVEISGTAPPKRQKDAGLDIVKGVIDGRIVVSDDTVHAVRAALEGEKVHDSVAVDVACAANAAASATSTARAANASLLGVARNDRISSATMRGAACAASSSAAKSAAAAHEAVHHAAAGNSEVARAHAAVAKATATSAAKSAGVVLTRFQGSAQPESTTAEVPPLHGRRVAAVVPLDHRIRRGQRMEAASASQSESRASLAVQPPMSAIPRCRSSSCAARRLGTATSPPPPRRRPGVSPELAVNRARSSSVARTDHDLYRGDTGSRTQMEHRDRERQRDVLAMHREQRKRKESMQRERRRL